MIPDAPPPRRIHVSAAVITDADGRLLLVRKAGTTAFMQPGGKPEAGETPAETLARELAEEVGLRVRADELEPLGSYPRAPRTNRGSRSWPRSSASTSATSSRSRMPRSPIRWVTAATASGLEIAPLAREYFLPAG